MPGPGSTPPEVRKRLDEAERGHFGEPWRVLDNGEIVDFRGRWLYHDEERTNRRIVACVNACVGVPTEALESLPGEVSDFVASLIAKRTGGRSDS